jgi:adenosylmethionine-8-amino-7-oxononanoate aminotransferase
MAKAAAEIFAFDQSNVWHPYTYVGDQIYGIVRSAVGTHLMLERVGAVPATSEVLDAMSSWWCVIHGYSEPSIVRSIRQQLETLSHVMFGGLTHEPAVTLCEKLIDITPEGLDRVFLCDSGSVSVEVALKMALQYRRSRGALRSGKLLTWRGGYHGDTFHPMSVCDPVGGLHHIWRGVLPEQIFLNRPPNDFGEDPDAGYSNYLRAAIRQHRKEIGAVIVEPVVQGTGSMRFHNPEYLRVLRESTAEFDIPLVFDEIATGFGRTGVMFASEHAGVSPDIMCVGKGLTGGFMSMAAVVCTETISSGIASGPDKILAHGPTFMGNPLSSAAAAASLDLLSTNYWKNAVANIQNGLKAGLAPAAALPHVVDVRVLGAIGVIELGRPVDIPLATSVALDNGVWIRPFRNLIYCMPPYIASAEEIAQISAAMVHATRAQERHPPGDVH